jgi:long-chain acyl-CoA synthetase
MKVSIISLLTVMALAVADCAHLIQRNSSEINHDGKKRQNCDSGQNFHHGVKFPYINIEIDTQEFSGLDESPVYKLKLDVQEPMIPILQNQRFEEICTSIEFKDKNFMATLDDGKHRWITYSEALKRVKQIHSGLVTKFDLKKGARVGIYLANSPEWILLDHACIRGGFVSVPMNARSNQSEIKKIIQNSKVKTLFFGPQQKTTVESMKLTGINLILVSEDAKDGNFYTLKSIEQSESIHQGKFSGQVKSSHHGGAINIANLNEITKVDNELKSSEFSDSSKSLYAVKSSVELLVQPAEIYEDDIFSIIYTSGTTGKDPKGAVMTHKALASKLRAIEIMSKSDKIPNFFNSHAQYFSFLPLSHVLERILLHFLLNVGGSVVFFSGSRDDFVREMGMAKPTFLAAVPKILEAFYDDAREKLSSSFFKRNLIEYLLANRQNNGFFHKKLRNQVLSSVRKKFGGNISAILTGAAAINPKVHEFISFLFGCPVYQGYGLTETFGASFMTWTGDSDVGHVGFPFPFTKFKLVPVEDIENHFEIHIGGVGSYLGYLNTEGELEKNSTNWHPTGDLGILDSQGRLKIIGRINGSFKLNTGEFVVPANVESAIKLVFPFVQDSFVCSSKTNTKVVAIISIKKDYQDIPTKDKFLINLQKSLRLNQEIKNYEIPVDLYFTFDQWRDDLEVYTSTFKMKRNAMQKRYQQEIDKLGSSA